LNNFFSQFTIKDLENLSGVKAHTIRIWEKRYQLLQPKRTETNIRYYDLADLKKLLNVSLLNRMGNKISYISKLSDAQIHALVQHTSSIEESEKGFIDTLVMAMLTFDQTLLARTYEQLEAAYSFSEIFQKIFLPLLNYIGLHWQSNSITPAHEHFISNYIRQKLYSQIENIPPITKKKNQPIYVLYLPENEIHEIGLLYLHLEILMRGKPSIYLGPSIPLDSLHSFQNIFSKIVYISYFTINPIAAELRNYLEKFQDSLLGDDKNQLWLSGPRIREIEAKLEFERIISFKNYAEMLNEI